MPRKSQSMAKDAIPGSAFKRRPSHESAPAPASKRPRRQASATSLKSTPNKSKYFEDSSESDQETSDDPVDDNESAFEDDAGDIKSSSEDSDPDDSTAEEDETPKQRAKSKASTPSSASKAKGPGSAKHVWKDGVKAGLGPGTQVIIKKPKARPAGSTAYQDDTIHPNTMLFLKDLKANNNRPWLKAHDPDFRQSEQDWKSYVEALTEKIAEADETVPELPYKDVVFRIYRDVRFSKDPTPYKAHFSAAWSRTGRKGPYAGYYIHLEPNGKSLVAAGLWMPEASALAKMRHDIDRRSHRFKQILTEPSLRKEFLDGVANNEAKAVKNFCNHNSESALKTKPKGYDPDHADIDLLRLKSFTISRRVSDDEITRPTSLHRVIELVACLVPFVTYLNSVVMPDEEPSDDDDDNNNGEDETETEPDT